jgi:peroxiredoxin
MRVKARFGISAAATWLVLGCSSQPPPKSQESTLLGDVMPSFETRTLNGNPLFSGAYEGRRVVVSFVAGDCAACDKTLEAAQGMYADLSDVVVVGVFGPNETADANLMVQRNELRFPVVVDENGKIAELFRVAERPTTFVADGYGRVKWVGGAGLTQDQLTSAVQSVD